MTQPATSAERRTLLFSGHVQGVGFRATTVHLAQDLPLSGEVRNRDDGSVELTLEGPPAAIDTLLARLREHFGSFLRTVDQHRATPTGNLPPGVRITY